MLTKKQLKFIAIIIMLLDHFALIFLSPALNGNTDILNKLHLSLPAATLINGIILSIATFTGTIMIYFVIEGYFYTHNIKKYFMRLILFGFLSQIPYMWAFNLNLLNMCFTLALCLATVYVHFNIHESSKRGWLLLIFLFINIFTDWNMLAIPFTLFLVNAFTLTDHYPGYSVDIFMLKKAWLQCIAVLIIINIISSLPPTRIFMDTTGTIIAAILITYYYNGLHPKSLKGKDSGNASQLQKYFFYVFYPLHIIILKMIYINL